MSRFLAAAIAASTLLGAGVASAQSSPPASRAAEAASVPSPSAARRCAGAACLQQIPSLGVGF